MDMSELFRRTKPVIGMLHVPPLPGSPANALSLSAIRDWVCRDAEALTKGGVDGLILENYGDAPFFPRRVPPHTVAFMTAIGSEVRSRFALPLGINILRNDGISAIAVAAAVEAVFVRVNVYTGARLTDQGILEGEAHKLLRYRGLLKNPVRVFADVAVKHSAALANRPLAEEIDDTILRGRADAIIISGAATGSETRLEDLKAAKAAAGSTPVLAGSGTTCSNAARVLAVADGVIVGTALKEHGVPANPVDPSRVHKFMTGLRDAGWE
jgi:membrane complex biogenesis BtpA family protein